MHAITCKDMCNSRVFALASAKLPADEDWMEWDIFMNHEWFFQTVILQEATLSGPAIVYIFCGSTFVLAGVVMLSLSLVFETHWKLIVLATMTVASKRDL